MSENRIESDSLGEIEVPESAYWRAQAERARRNFPVSGLRFQRRFLAALGLIKAEAAAVNAELGPTARGTVGISSPSTTSYFTERPAGSMTCTM